MAMPVVNANARAKTRKIFFMAISPLDDEVVRRRLGGSVTGVTFWSFLASGLRPPASLGVPVA
jgi:hypothetical protein